MSFPVYCFITPVLLNNENLMDIFVTDCLKCAYEDAIYWFIEPLMNKITHTSRNFIHKFGTK